MTTWQITGLTCVLAASLIGCAHSGDSQVLQYRGAVQPLRTGQSCQATDTTRLLDHPVLDLAMAKSYRFFPALQSMLPKLTAIPGINPNVQDTNTINMTSMTVSVQSGMVNTSPFGNKTGVAGGPTSPTKTWTVPMSGTMEAQGTLITGADLVPEKALVGSKFVPVGEDWRSRFWSSATGSTKDFSKVEIILSFQFTGVTLSGDNVITDVATLPMTVCYGCLLTPATVSPTIDAGSYYAGCGTASVPSDALIACLPGQDDYMDCRYYCHECQKSKPINGPGYDGCDTKTLCVP